MYSDLQMIIASQIAYLNLEEGYTVGQILEMEMESSDPTYAERAEKLRERINELPPHQREACEKWIVMDVRDDQHSSGMYACMLETGEGDALIGFRGSESDTLEQVGRDWVAADVGLLNSVLTHQQQEAQKYIQDLYNRYGDHYDSFAMTGHSLGGNLAMHAAITAPDGMRDQIVQCVNLDGPGFSNNYIMAHLSDISKSKDVLSHYAWSWVGSLLMPIPGVEYSVKDAETPEDGGVLWRHDTYSVTNFDENGNILPGKKDWLAIILDPFSKVIDLSFFTICGFGGIALVYNNFDALKDEIKNLWETWQQIRIAGRHAQFEIDPQALSNGLQHSSAISARLENACQSVERIQSQLAFDSIVSIYVKTKLWRISGNIENNKNKLKTYREKGNECGWGYKNYDRKTADNYL